MRDYGPSSLVENSEDMLSCVQCDRAAICQSYGHLRGPHQEIQNQDIGLSPVQHTVNELAPI